MAKDILDLCDSEEVTNAPIDEERSPRTYALDFGLNDPMKGEKTFTFNLLLKDFIEHDGDNSDNFIMEFDVIESDCVGVPEGGTLTHFVRRDGDKRYAMERAKEIRDAIGGTLGLSRGEKFSVKDRVKELLAMAGAETLGDAMIVMNLRLTRRNYERGVKSPRAGQPGHTVKAVWTSVEV